MHVAPIILRNLHWLRNSATTSTPAIRFTSSIFSIGYCIMERFTFCFTLCKINVLLSLNVRFCSPCRLIMLCDVVWVHCLISNMLLMYPCSTLQNRIALLLYEVHTCTPVHTSLPCTTHSQHYCLIMGPTGQLKTAVMFVVDKSTIYMVLQLMW